MGVAGGNVTNFRTKTIKVTMAVPSAAVHQNDLIVGATSFSVGNSSVIGTINSACVIDNDDKGIQLDFWFSDKQETPNFGTVNAVPSLSTDDAESVMGRIDSGATFFDFANSKIATPAAFAPIPFETANGTLYVAALLTGATTTFGGGNVILKLGVTIERDL